VVNNTSYHDLFSDYYFNNKGTLYKSFEISINNFHGSYDIYWGDPNVIFDKRSLKEKFPLAVTTIPHRYNYPNPRIFLHEKLENMFNNIFEVVIAHEIGHIWLHDIIGFNNPSTNNVMKENESEIWADYFSYSYFIKYRNINCLVNFIKILEETSNFQIKLYNLSPEQHMEFTFTRKIESLKLLEENINYGFKVGNQITIQMINTIEMTLNALGDIFN
jgi:hypothetical protein